jgi:hypothetical protein
VSNIDTNNGVNKYRSVLYLVKFTPEDNLRGIKLFYHDNDPMSWAVGKAGWVTLHDHERSTLKVLMKTMNATRIEECEIPLFKGGRLQKYYRLLVPDLSLAFEIIRMARLTQHFR